MDTAGGRLPPVPSRPAGLQKSSFLWQMGFLPSCCPSNDFGPKSWCDQGPPNGEPSSVRGACLLRAGVGGGSVWRETTQKPSGRAQWGLRSMPGWSSDVHGHLAVRKKAQEGRSTQTRLSAPLLRYSPEAEIGKSFSSFFSRCTSDTLFILVKIWLISMNVLPLVSGTTRKM